MKYANHHCHTDIQPYEVVRVISDKTIEIREMKATKDGSQNLEFVQGGFSHICTNQHAQKWVIESKPEAKVIRARKRADGKFYSIYGKHILSDKPRKFYDYNF
jgi:hypothetical protein